MISVYACVCVRVREKERDHGHAYGRLPASHLEIIREPLSCNRSLWREAKAKDEREEELLPGEEK